MKEIEKGLIKKNLNQKEIEKEQKKKDLNQKKIEKKLKKKDLNKIEIKRIEELIQLNLKSYVQLLKFQGLANRFPPSLNPHVLVGIIPNRQHAYQEGLKIIRTVKYRHSTVAFNPIISNGIVRFGGFFEDPSNDPFFSIGVTDSSAVFGSCQAPWDRE
ncbi:MAG: hypothetical protein EZS28_027643, partial [Streblomastix strix]